MSTAIRNSILSIYGLLTIAVMVIVPTITFWALNSNGSTDLPTAIAISLAVTTAFLIVMVVGHIASERDAENYRTRLRTRRTTTSQHHTKRKDHRGLQRHAQSEPTR